MTLDAQSVCDLLTPMNLAERTDPRYKRARHLELIEREALETLHPDGWDILVVQAPPRHGKSEFLSNKLPTWWHLVYPDLRSILASYSLDLARTHCRKVRNGVHALAPLYGIPGVSRTVAQSTQWEIESYRGGMRAVGVRGSVTGFGGDLVLIDDYLKDAKDAISDNMRDAQWEWLQTTIMTRIEPGGRMIVLACLVGDTEIRTRSGSKCIRDIVRGDSVACFVNGSLGYAKVRNSAKVGNDEVFSVVTKSGKRVVGNARHPFLVLRDGVLQWVRLKNLIAGDALVTERASGANANLTSNVSHATDLFTQGCIAKFITNSFASGGRKIRHCHTGTVSITTQLANGVNRSSTSEKSNVSIGPLRTGCASGTQTKLRGCLEEGKTTPKQHSNQNSCTDTRSRSTNTDGSTNNNRGDAPFVEKCRFQASTYRRTGRRNFASTIVTQPERFADCCVTDAIWQSETSLAQTWPKSSLNTCDFTTDTIVSIEYAGSEPVYDIEVDGVGNFIANGCVTHNTRWHETDIIGRLLKYCLEDSASSYRIRELRLPAIAEPTEAQPDPLGRKTGEALWPERIPLSLLEKRRSLMDPYWWNALFQQRLGSYGHNEWPTEYFYGIFANDDEWPERFSLSATALDPSKGKNAKKGDPSAIVHVGFAKGYLWVDCDMERRPVPKMVSDLVAFNMQRRPTVTGIEAVAFQELLGPIYAQECNAAGYYDEPVLIENTVSKEIRIARLGTWLRLHMLKIRRNAGGIWLEQMLRGFPNASHDDGPDALEMAIRLLTQLSEGLAAAAEAAEEFQKPRLY